SPLGGFLLSHGPPGAGGGGPGRWKHGGRARSLSRSECARLRPGLLRWSEVAQWQRRSEKSKKSSESSTGRAMAGGRAPNLAQFVSPSWCELTSTGSEVG